MEVQRLRELKQDYDFANARILNKGATAHVSKITKISNGVIYAMKTVYKGHSRQKNSNIQREKFTLECLDHFNIIKLFAVYEDNQDVHFILPWMETDLFRWVAAYHKKYNGERGLPIECVKYHGAELVNALQYMKSQGFVHRDIKVENIMMTADQHIKLSDFGTAKYIMDRQGQIKRESNTYVGTHEYLPPEIMSEGPVTYGSDLWGLANVLSYTYYTFWVCQMDNRHDADESAYYSRLHQGIIGFPSDKPDRVPLLENLIRNLVKYYPSMRCGSRSFEHLKNHRFWVGIDFESLEWTPPPPLLRDGVEEALNAEEEIIPALERVDDYTEPDASQYNRASIFNSPTYLSQRDEYRERQLELNPNRPPSPRQQLFFDERDDARLVPSSADPDHIEADPETGKLPSSAIQSINPRERKGCFARCMARVPFQKLMARNRDDPMVPSVFMAPEGKPELRRTRSTTPEDPGDPEEPKCYFHFDDESWDSARTPPPEEESGWCPPPCTLM